MKVVINKGDGSLRWTKEFYLAVCAPFDGTKIERVGNSVRAVADPGEVSGMLLSWEPARESMEVFRSNPLVIEAVAQLGNKAVRNGELKIVEIPEGVDFYIESEEGGYESVHEAHRFWA